MEIPLPEVISAGGAIAATSVVFTKYFSQKFGRLETVLSKLSDSVIELDKRLAVNSCIIDTFLKEECHGHRRNKKTD
jgi:hypothetical protein